MRRPCALAGVHLVLHSMAGIRPLNTDREHTQPMTENPHPTEQDHSLDEVVFALQFAQELSEDQLQTLLAGGVEGLPHKETRKSYAFEMRDEEIQTSKAVPEVTEVRLSHQLDDGAADWRLRVTRSFASLSCFCYTRWSAVWPRAREILQSVAEILVTPETPLQVVGLQYVDQFIREMGAEDYRSADLFQENSPFLSQQVIQAGPLWHLHQGWFQDPSVSSPREPANHSRILHRLNINASQLESYHHTSISHQMASEFEAGVPTTNALFEGNPALLDRVADELRAENTAVLERLLNVSIQAQIALDERQD